MVTKPLLFQLNQGTITIRNLKGHVRTIGLFWKLTDKTENISEFPYFGFWFTYKTLVCG